MAVRRQFGRRTAEPDAADFLLREIERRMFERMQLIRAAPARVLDVGCGLGAGTRALAARYADAQVIGIDSAPRRAVLAARAERGEGAGRADRANRVERAPGGSRGGALRGWLDAIRSSLASRAGPNATRAAPGFVAADAQALPFADSAFDLVWSNLALHWFDAPDAAIAEWYRVIRPRGLLMFTSFGVDTLAELRAAGSATMPFPDLHDIGDSLVAAGFADPVMDVERLVVRYERPERLLADLRALGGDALRARRRGLATARDRERLVQALRAPLSLTFEIVYGHAWCGERKKLPDGLAPIEFQPRLRRAGPARGARAAVAPARAVVAGAFCRSL